MVKDGISSLIISPKSSLLVGKTYTVFVSGTVRTDPTVQTQGSVKHHLAFMDVSIPFVALNFDNTAPKINSFQSQISVTAGV